LIEGFGKLTEAMMEPAGFSNLVSTVWRQRHLEAAQNGSFPHHKMPRAGSVLILATLNEWGFDSDLGA